MLKNFNKLIAAFALTFAFGVITAPAQADMASWKKAVAKKVAKKQKYPRSALAREIEGRAKAHSAGNTTDNLPVVTRLTRRRPQRALAANQTV